MDKGMIHVPGGVAQDGARVHPASQNGMQFKLRNYFWNLPFNVTIIITISIIHDFNCSI